MSGGNGSSGWLDMAPQVEELILDRGVTVPGWHAEDETRRRFTDQVAKLQETLNQNLRTLAGAKNFEQTVMSLAAVIHLLNARLGELPGDSPQVELELDDANRKSQAA